MRKTTLGLAFIISVTALVFTGILFSHYKTVFVQAQTASTIGYVSESSAVASGGACSPTSYIAGQQVIYNSYGTQQGPYGCIQSITLTTSDSVHLLCAIPFTGLTPPPGWTSYSAPTITGPGTFIENCTSVGGLFNSFYLIAESPNSKPPPVLSSVTPSPVKVGGSITVNGSGFVPTGTELQAFNSAGTPVFVNAPSGTSNGSSVSMTLPPNLGPGQYGIQAFGPPYVGFGTSANYSNEIYFQIQGNGPSNLTTTLGITGKAALKWTDNSANETGFSIERATDAAQSQFVAITTTKAGVTSYTDDLTNVNLPSAKEAYRVRAVFADGTYSDYSNVSSISNCVNISGSGPDTIVFMRGKSLGLDTAGFLSNITSIINNGYKVVDPFKSYISRFTFIADFQQFDESVLPVDIVNGQHSTSGAVSVARDTLVKSGSSCGGSEYEYILTFASPNNTYAGFSTPEDRVVYLPLPVPSNIYMPEDVIHESGHAIAGLLDEYQLAPTGVDTLTDTGASNCVRDPIMSYTSPVSNLIYGAVTTAVTKSIPGCEYAQDPRTGNSYYRPSQTSIMVAVDPTYALFHTTPKNMKFNVISCGYVLLDIMRYSTGYQTTLANVAQYWPACMKLNTFQDGIPPVNTSVPAIAGISTRALTPGDPVITGTNFTPTGNSVQMVNVADNSIIYDFSNLPSSDSRTISFTVPTNAVSGTYTLKVGAFNSAWSSPITVTIAPPLNLNGLTCNVVPSNNGTSGSTGGYGGYIFNTTPSGGIAPYSYTLNNIPFASPGNGSISGINVLNYMPSYVWTPGFAFSFYNSAFSTGASLIVASSDGQSQTVQCTLQTSAKSAPVAKPKVIPVPASPTVITIPTPVTTTPTQTTPVQPSITAISPDPSSAYQGTQASITGSNFVTGSQVYLAYTSTQSAQTSFSQNITPNDVSSTLIHFTVPTNAPIGSYVVQVISGNVTSNLYSWGISATPIQTPVQAVPASPAKSPNSTLIMIDPYWLVASIWNAVKYTFSSFNVYLK